MSSDSHGIAPTVRQPSPCVKPIETGFLYEHRRHQRADDEVAAMTGDADARHK
jgi:hypothetical protein